VIPYRGFAVIRPAAHAFSPQGLKRLNSGILGRLNG
jgi:hypothetical protein